MKTGPNKLRYLGYIDDGVYGFHCMRCGERMNLRGKDPEFCCYCGTRWELGHVWYPPRRWELQQRRDTSYSRWIIENRIRWNPQDEPGEWNTWGLCGPHERLELVRKLRQLREENTPEQIGYIEEYRATFVKRTA